MDNKFYVYVYLDPRKPGNYVYGEYHFEYEPFYVGKGCGRRMYIHLNEAKISFNEGNQHKLNKIRKIQNETGNDPIIITYKDNLYEEESHKLEIDLISKIGTLELKTGVLTNLTTGGDGCSRICKPETKEKISKANKGKKLSEESRRKMSESRKGRKLTDFQKQALLNSVKGKRKTEEHKQKLRESQLGEKGWFFGKHHSDEIKRKISDSNKGKKKPISKEHALKISKILTELYKTKPNSMTGKKHTDKTKRLMSSQRKGENNANSKKWLIITETEQLYLITTELRKYCKENSISYKKLRKAHKEGLCYKNIILELQ